MSVYVPVTVSAKNALFVAHYVIDSRVVLVRVRTSGGIYAVVHRSTCQARIGNGPIVKNICHCVGCRINPVPANHVQHAIANELLACLRVVDRGIGTEVSAQLGGRRSSALKRNSISPGKPLVTKKEKRAFLYDRSSDRDAELVLDEL